MLKLRLTAYTILLCAVIILSSGLTPVSAYTETNLGASIYDVGDGGTTAYPYGGNIDNRVIQMTNGDIVTSYITTHASTGYSVVTIKVISVIGELKATSTYTVDASGTTNPHTTVIVSMFPDYEPNVCLIFISDRTSTKATMTVLEYNIVSHNITPVSMDAHVATVGAEYNNIGSYYYDGDIYFVINCQVSTDSWMQVYKYSIGGALTWEIQETGIANHKLELVGGFQDPNDQSILYAMTCDYGNNAGTPKYWIIDFAEETIELLATDGDGSLCSPVPFASHFRGGGKEIVNATYVLYFNWDYVIRETYQTSVVIQNRLQFNSTISEGGLIAQNNKIFTIQDTISDSGTSTAGIHVYWTSKSEAHTYYIFHNNLDLWVSQKLTIEDWDIMDNEIFQLDDLVYGVDAFFSSVMEEYSIFVKKPTKNYALVAVDSTHLYIVTDLVVDNSDISVYLTSHTPNDTTLSTNKSYTYRVSAFQSGLPYTLGSVGFQIDNGLLSVKSTGLIGYADFTQILAIAGLHTITVTAYDNANVLDTKVYSYVFIIGTVDETTDENSGLALTIGMFTQIIAPATILLVPTFIFYGMTQTSVGAIAGLMMGALLGLVGGVIPAYVLVVTIIIAVMFLFYATKGG